MLEGFAVKITLPNAMMALQGSSDAARCGMHMMQE
jgi:hypothetical protein